MNLNKLFDTQRILDARIEKEHPRVEGEDRLAKKILALQVELGELANEWRGFKFWSNDQEPRTKLFDEEFDLIHMESIGLEQKNPLLEEYVDCLHFILSIALETKSAFVLSRGVSDDFKHDNVRIQFSQVFHDISIISYSVDEGYNVIRHDDVQDLFNDFYHLGELFGFTWEQIEQAYYDKNAINHTRQDTGY